MKYYRYRPDADRFASIGAAMADSDRVIDVHYQDRPLAASWRPVSFHGFDDDPDEEGDFPSLNEFYRIPIFSQRAWDRLRELIGYCCEALPIVHPTRAPFYLIHVMETIDCLDVEKSEVKRFSFGDIMSIKRYAFVTRLVRDKIVFKLPRECAGELIVNDRFREAVEGNDLTGLLFKELPMADAVS